jgi:hypothetical protein
MAIQLEFIDFIVPIKTIKEKYPGGWERCLKDHAHLIGGRVWYDNHLFHDGAMNPTDISHLVYQWEGRGFTIFGFDDNRKENRWVDVCVYERMFGGATLECDWIEYDAELDGVFLKGTSPGKLIGRADFATVDKIPDWIFE